MPTWFPPLDHFCRGEHLRTGPTGLFTPSPHHSWTIKWKRFDPEQPEGRLSKRTDSEPARTAKDSPLRKRTQECGGGGAVKRPRLETANSHLNSVDTVMVHPPSQAPAPGWIRSSGHVTGRTPWGFASSSQTLWDVGAFAERSNSWWLHSAQKDLHAFRAPPLYFSSLARQQQQVAHFRAVREFSQARFLAPLYHWPPSGSVAGHGRAAATSR